MGGGSFAHSLRVCGRMCGLLCGHVCELLCAKTDTFFSIFSSSKVARLEDQVRAPSPPPLDWGSDEACSKSISVLWEHAEGGEDFLGDADEGGADVADDSPKVVKPVETPPSLIQ